MTGLVVEDSKGKAVPKAPACGKAAIDATTQAVVATIADKYEMRLRCMAEWSERTGAPERIHHRPCKGR